VVDLFAAEGTHTGIADLSAVADNYGHQTGSLAAAPEPGVLMLLAAWAPAAPRRRRSG